MKNWLRLFLLFTPALISLGLLSVAFSTNWWIITLEKNIPKENSLIQSNNTRLHSTLIPIIIYHGLLSECIGYRQINILISNDFDFRENNSPKIFNETCSNNQFTCQTSVAIARPLTRCIDQQKKCNHIIDCEDKSDELLCNISICEKGYTKCSDEKVCYRKDEQTCDGVVNCMDNSDEENCNELKCSLNKHVYCSREKKCARRENSARCDGIIDCEDSSDEENCQQCNGDKYNFLCDSKCFLGKYRCDSIVHCSDFRDELNCEDYSSTKKSQEIIYYKNHLCEEKRFNPFHLSTSKIDSNILEFYPNPEQRKEDLIIMYHLQLITFFGIISSLLWILLSIISLSCFICCHHKYMNLPFYFYGLWILLAWLFINIALIAFIGLWFWKKTILTDDERNVSFEIMKYKMNPSLQNLEFFGLSFWLACGAALSTFIGLLLSCCICCTVGSARSENKEYEIMHMQNY